VLTSETCPAPTLQTREVPMSELYPTLSLQTGEISKLHGLKGRAVTTNRNSKNK